MAESVAGDVGSLDGVDELTAHVRRLVTDGHWIGRIVLSRNVAKKIRRQPLRSFGDFRRIECQLLRVPLEQGDDAIRDPAGMRQIERDIEVGHEGRNVSWRIALVVLTIVAAILRIPSLFRPMGSDEAATFLYYASHPLSVAVTIYGSPNNHILHSVLMHFSYLLFGRAEWALRLPAFLAGVALVPLTYLASRAVADRGALLAASLAASAPVLIDYSTDARGYTLLCCFVLICVAAIASGGARTFAASGALGFYTIPVMLYPFVMLVIWGRTKALRGAIAAIVIAAALYAPALIISGMASLTSNPYVRPLPMGVFLRNVPSYVLTVAAHLFVGIPIVIQVLIAIGFVIGVRRQPMWIGFFAVIVLVALQRVLPFPRVWLPFLLLAFITAATAWPWSRSEPAVAAAVILALGLTGFTTERIRETGELRAVREITRELNVRAQKGDPVLALQPSEMPIAFYCPKVEVLNPDLNGPRLFVVENRDFGQTLPRTLAFFKVDPRRYSIRRLRDFGSSALYELRRGGQVFPSAFFLRSGEKIYEREKKGRRKDLTPITHRSPRSYSGFFFPISH